MFHGGLFERHRPRARQLARRIDVAEEDTRQSTTRFLAQVRLLDERRARIHPRKFEWRTRVVNYDDLRQLPCQNLRNCLIMAIRKLQVRTIAAFAFKRLTMANLGSRKDENRIRLRSFAAQIFKRAAFRGQLPTEFHLVLSCIARIANFKIIDRARLERGLTLNAPKLRTARNHLAIHDNLSAAAMVHLHSKSIIARLRREQLREVTHAEVMRIQAFKRCLFRFRKAGLTRKTCLERRARAILLVVIPRHFPRTNTHTRIARRRIKRAN